jgi:hypothetical protein
VAVAVFLQVLLVEQAVQVAVAVVVLALLVVLEV